MLLSAVGDILNYEQNTMGSFFIVYPPGVQQHDPVTDSWERMLYSIVLKDGILFQYFI